LILSNRLPVTLRVTDGEVSVEPSAGGLSTAVRGVHEEGDSLWIGWSGSPAPACAEARRAIEARLAGERAVPVHLDEAEITGYYDRFSNGTLWPLFHYFLDLADIDDSDAFATYEAVSRRFAEAALAHLLPGDHLWVHDYHLMLVPEMVREQRPEARIGFFLHTPFPSSEVVRMLPQRERLLHGLLGADVIGFQTASYRRHFVQSIAHLLDLAPEPDESAVTYEGRRVRLGVYPIGVDAAAFAALAESPAVRAEAREIQEQAPGGRVVLGVDRLDYTKGVRLRLAAVERLLDRSPELRDLRFVQIAVPTRESVGAYEQMRREVHEMVGRINGRHGSVGSMPVHFLYQSLPVERLAALYAAADVMLVTPLRDGMNLVAKEYVATRTDGGGALVLSELTGAAVELVEALIVNPYDTGAVAAAIARALSMPDDERRARMVALRRRVAEGDVHRWARSFLDDLARIPGPPPPTPAAGTVAVERALTRARSAPSLTLILDYDGTLVPLAPLPELAPPDADLHALLADLAGRPGTRVHLASGRKWEDLDRWLGALPIHLHAEHGACWRPPGGSWTHEPGPPPTWKAAVREVMEEITRRTPGSLIEEKTTSLAWHHRTVAPELTLPRERELAEALGSILGARDLQAIRGLRVLEVRPRGPGKALAVARARAGAPAGTLIVAVGDDATDEDLFGALPAGALSIHVGHGASAASLRLPDPAAVREFLRALLPGC
jgi:trehalose 6-phosphate synthase/phosphatase